MPFDIRLSGRNQAPVVFTDDDVEVALPTKKEVCPACRGNGSHVNPSIDAHGLTREDFDADPDFAENYMAGGYDVTCYVCGGLRVVDVVDEGRCDPQLLATYQRQKSDREHDDAIARSERAAEARACGEWD